MAGPLADTRDVAHDVLEPLHERQEVGHFEVDVARHALGCLGLVEHAGELLALDVHDGPAEHLDEPTVEVPGEAVPNTEFTHRILWSA